MRWIPYGFFRESKRSTSAFRVMAAHDHKAKRLQNRSLEAFLIHLQPKAENWCKLISQPAT